MAIDNDNLMDDLAIQEEDTTKDKYLTFEIDKEEFGIEIKNIKEIISIQNITPVPETPGYIEGIINLRGDIIPVINVRKRFIKPTKEYDAMTCIVVIEFDKYVLGMIVDNVKQVIMIDESNVSTPPSAKLSNHNQYIRNIGKVGNSVKLLLDLEKFLFQDY